MGKDAAMDYEILIRRANKCERFGVPAADADIYRGLQAHSFLKTDINNKRLQQVKRYVLEALDKGISRVKKKGGSQTEINRMLDAITQVTGSTDVPQLSAAISEALDIFIELEITQ